MSPAALVVHPLPISFALQLWLVIPLCLAVAVIYKTIRVNDLRSLPLQIVLLGGYMLGGLTALALVLWLISAYWP
jgi:hypothetical protein